MGKPKRLGCAAVSLTMACVAGPALAEKAAENPDRKPWSNETEFNLAFTEGNSNTGTLGLKNTLVRRWSTARFRLKLEALRSANSDDWYLQVDPGFTWQPGEDPSASVTKSLVKPPTEPDAENYFAEGRYDREIRSSLSWHAGTSWDRNEDAGILNRVIAFTGLGNLWLNQTDHRLLTSYGLSWTDREEESPDPEKEDRFAGARASPGRATGTLGSPTAMWRLQRSARAHTLHPRYNRFLLLQDELHVLHGRHVLLSWDRKERSLSHRRPSQDRGEAEGQCDDAT